MRVRFEDLSIFNTGDGDIYRQLQRLFVRAALGQHELDLYDPEEVLDSDFMQTASSTLTRPEWQELVYRTAATLAFAPTTEPRAQAVITRAPSDQNSNAEFIIPTSKAGVWAEQPLRIALENERDQVLVKLALQESNSTRLQQALESGWLKAEGRGGSGEVYKAILNAEHKYDRIFAILDSDREKIHGDEGTAARLTRRRLLELRNIKQEALKHPREKDRDLPLHVLKRRELENYVPAAIWKALTSKSTSKRKSTPPPKGVDHRTVLVYRWILRLIELHEEDANRHGADALQKVLSSLEQKATKKVPSHFTHEQLEEWTQLTTEQKDVDDLKVRFGSSTAEHAITQLNDKNFDITWLDESAREELRELAEKLEDWL